MNLLIFGEKEFTMIDMENINAIRLIKALVEISPTSELMNEQDRKELMEYIDVQIVIESEFAE